MVHGGGGGGCPGGPPFGGGPPMVGVAPLPIKCDTGMETLLSTFLHFLLLFESFKRNGS